MSLSTILSFPSIGVVEIVSISLRIVHLEFYGEFG